MKIYLEWIEIPCIGIHSGPFGKTLVFGSWMHELSSYSVQVKASKILGSDNRESSNCHNHACDKTKLIGA
jgi:hypothetical protein